MLELRGGAWGALLLVGIALTLVALAAVNNSRIDGYAVAFLVPVLVAVLLATNEQAYGRAVIGGLTKPMFAIIPLAVLLASIAGGLVRASGAVETLAGMAVSAGITGRHFAAFTFVLTCLIAFSTGTSVGTYFVVVPISVSGWSRRAFDWPTWGTRGACARSRSPSRPSARTGSRGSPRRAPRWSSSARGWSRPGTTASRCTGSRSGAR